MRELFEIDKKYFMIKSNDPKVDEVHFEMIKEFYLLDDEGAENFLWDCINIILVEKNKKVKIIHSSIEKAVSKIKIDYNKYEKIINKDTLAAALMAFFIYRSIMKGDNRRFEDNVTSLNIKNHSDKIINNFLLYVKKLIRWLDMLSDCEFSFDEISGRLACMLILKELSYINKIKSIKIWQNGKTMEIFSIPAKKTYSKEVIFSLSEFKICSKGVLFIYSFHYLTIDEIFRENPQSKHTFLFQNESILKKLSKNWVYLDKTILNWIISDLCNEAKVPFSEIDTYYEELTKNQESLINEKDIKAVSDIAKKISLIDNIKRLKKIENFQLYDLKVFLPFWFDFRGRLYFGSSVSPTMYKEIRYCIHWGPYVDIRVKKHTYNDIIEAELDKYAEKIKNWKLFNFVDKQIEVIRGIAWILISIAEVEKWKNKEIHISDFIANGIQIVENFQFKKMKIDDFIKVKYLIFVLNEISKGLLITRPIPKDATASVYQHLIKSLGSKNSTALKLCNLNSKDTWYDTYAFIIDEFKNKTNYQHLDDEDFKNIFSRKHLKKTIMIENYGAGEKKCWREFQQEVDMDVFSEIKKKEISDIFQKFYVFLKINDLILKVRPEMIAEVLSKNDANWWISLFDEAKVPLIYLTRNIKQIETSKKKRRVTKQHIILTNIIDINKIIIACRANYVQSMDASLVRWFLKENNAITIHDCFLIDYLNVTYTVSKLNEGIRIIFHDLGIEEQVVTDEIFSIFIVL